MSVRCLLKQLKKLQLYFSVLFISCELARIKRNKIRQGATHPKSAVKQITKRRSNGI